ncbi:Eco57I restriction-modification methylase domain-containing protein [Nannocystis pusilla]|uniref:Eco57I restriction-modification methylase domain-containing protein n=1 Tax=Nannocystis pusilla TaxID=889268 RepID=UPI003B79BFC3
MSSPTPTSRASRPSSAARSAPSNTRTSASGEYHLAVHNCYGVDLDPQAAELGKASLWLGVLHAGAIAPQLGLRIAVGNSLIGARRAVFAPDALAPGRGPRSEPTPIPLTDARPDDCVYHFLVAEPGMAGFDDDRPLKSLAPAAAARIHAWRRQLLAVDPRLEWARLSAICARIDALWCAHLDERRAALQAVRQPLALWGQPTESSDPRASVPVTEAAALTRADAPGRKLAAIMDYWCALWFWPIDQVDALPTREQWLADVEQLLATDDLDRVMASPALAVVRRVAGEQRFFHWEVAFPEVFAAGGMDIVLGNPPWTKVVWEEAGVLAELQPRLGIDKSAATVSPAERQRLLADPAARGLYFRELTTNIGTLFLGSRLYAFLGGTASNLYKAFLVRAWSLAGPRAVVGLFHQTGVFDDPAGGPLRAELHRRLRFAARFQNKLMLFPEVLHTRPYAFTICAGRREAPNSATSPTSTTRAPSTPAWSMTAAARSPASRMTTARGTSAATATASCASTPMPSPCSAQCSTPLKLRSPRRACRSSTARRCWRSCTSSPPRRGACSTSPTITPSASIFMRPTSSRTARSAAPLAGPTTSRSGSSPARITTSPRRWPAIPTRPVAATWTTPRSTSPRSPPTSSRAPIPPRLPRRRIRGPQPALARCPARCPPPMDRPQDAVALRRADPDLRRPPARPGPHRRQRQPRLQRRRHHRPFRRPDRLAALRLLAQDHRQVEPQQRRHQVPAAAGRRARCDRPAHIAAQLSHRALRRAVARSLRRRVPPRRFCHCRPAAARPGRPRPALDPDTPLRTPFARRQALVELDVLAALALGLSLAELLAIYRLQFAVLQQNERGTWYDRRGKVVFSDNILLADLGLGRRQWQPIADARAGDLLPPWACDALGPYVPPFDRCDREADLRRAYEHFAARL